MLAPGTFIKEGIRLEREIGRGAMGVVWLATQVAISRSIAVKFLADDAAQHEETRARFTREAQTMARIDSPYVVHLLDFSATSDGHPFMLLELLRGHDLKTRLTEQGALGVDDTIKVVEQTASALTSAHAAGIIHRDIKPANLFLQDVGPGIFVKVLDFGVAKAEHHDGLDLTKTEALLGTPYYMSPEQFVDAKRIDARSDLWSLAVVAYACLTGRLPFLGESVGALAVSVHKGQYVPACQVNPGLPAALDAWFAQALNPDRQKRFQSAQELASAFAAAARDVRAAAPASLQWSPAAPVPPEASTQAGNTSDQLTPLARSVGATTTAGTAPKRARRALYAAGAVALVGAAIAGIVVVPRYLRSAPRPAKSARLAPPSALATDTTVASVSAVPASCERAAECPDPVRDRCDTKQRQCKPAFHWIDLTVELTDAGLPPLQHRSPDYANFTATENGPQFGLGGEHYSFTFGPPEHATATDYPIGMNAFGSKVPSWIMITLNDLTLPPDRRGAYDSESGTLTVTKVDDRPGGVLEARIDAVLVNRSRKNLRIKARGTFHGTFANPPP